MELYWLVLGAAAVAALWVHALKPLVSKRELREALASLQARLEKCSAEHERTVNALTVCEAERAELRKRLEEREKLVAELGRRLDEAKTRVAELEEELRKQRESFETEKVRLREDCAKRVAEVARVSRTAATLYEAVRDGAVKVTVPGRNCVEVIIEPERILCQRGDGSLELVYPEEALVDEAIVVKTSRGKGGRD